MRHSETEIADTRQLARFTALVAVLAILADASVGHGLLWENDPYWTYWVTKTFLIATVFGLGTAWLGAGIGRGAILTAVHTVILTVYYWTLSPVGLPSHPEWLDLEHTWITGMPVHFSVIYLGYLAALWISRRREPHGAGEPRRDALVALGLAVAMVLTAGALTSAALDHFPGVTWFVVRLLLTVPFLLLWWSTAGRDWPAAVGGAVTLALLWATYAHFLAPNGLPGEPLRITSEEPPPADVNWLDYRELWLTSLPIYLGVAGVGLLAAVRRGAKVRWAPALALLALVAAPLLIALPGVDPGGDDATVNAAGSAQIETGAWYSGSMQPLNGSAELRLVAEDRGGRVSPLLPHDRVQATAQITHPDGGTYAIEATEPVVDDPLGRHGTWWGVGLDKWHHGDSGIGTKRLPALRSDVAVFATAEVSANGRPLAAGVPVHVMTIDDTDGLRARLELDVGDQAAPVPGLPDGHLRVLWDSYTGGADEGPKEARYAVGAVVLALLLALALLANVRNTGGRSRLTESAA